MSRWVGVSFVLLALGAWFVSHLTTLARSPEPVFTIRHELEIDASPETVWRVLTDFAAYPDWNPYVLHLAGDLALGETLELTIAQRNWNGPLTLYPTVARLEAPRTFGWHGRVGLAGLHETDHYFELKPLPDGRTRLVQTEEFRGWLPAWMDSESHRAPTREAFAAMDEALARRAAHESGR